MSFPVWHMSAGLAHHRTFAMSILAAPGRLKPAPPPAKMVAETGASRELARAEFVTPPRHLPYLAIASFYPHSKKHSLNSPEAYTIVLAHPLFKFNGYC